MGLLDCDALDCTVDVAGLLDMQTTVEMLQADNRSRNDNTQNNIHNSQYLFDRLGSNLNNINDVNITNRSPNSVAYSWQSCLLQSNESEELLTSAPTNTQAVSGSEPEVDWLAPEALGQCDVMGQETLRHPKLNSLPRSKKMTCTALNKVRNEVFGKLSVQTSTSLSSNRPRQTFVGGTGGEMINSQFPHHGKRGLETKENIFGYRAFEHTRLPTQGSGISSSATGQSSGKFTTTRCEDGGQHSSSSLPSSRTLSMGNLFLGSSSSSRVCAEDLIAGQLHAFRTVSHEIPRPSVGSVLTPPAFTFTPSWTAKSIFTHPPRFQFTVPSRTFQTQPLSASEGGRGDFSSPANTHEPANVQSPATVQSPITAHEPSCHNLQCCHYFQARCRECQISQSRNRNYSQDRNKDCLYPHGGRSDGQTSLRKIRDGQIFQVKNRNGQTSLGKSRDCQITAGVDDGDLRSAHGILSRDHGDIQQRSSSKSQNPDTSGHRRRMLHSRAGSNKEGQKQDHPIKSPQATPKHEISGHAKRSKATNRAKLNAEMLNFIYRLPPYFRFSEEMRQQKKHFQLRDDTRQGHVVNKRQSDAIENKEESLSSSSRSSSSSSSSFCSSPKSLIFADEELDTRKGLYHLDGYRMAPAPNNAYDYYMAENTCSEAQSEAEDASLDSLFQQCKTPPYQQHQQQSCMSELGGVSEAGEGFELMCGLSSSQLTLEDAVNNSIVSSVSGASEMSPAECSVSGVGSPALSSSSLAATAGTVGTHHDSLWPTVSDDETNTEIFPRQKGEKRKICTGDGRPSRQPIDNYQTVTPWTNNTSRHARNSFTNSSLDIPSLLLNPRVLEGQSSLTHRVRSSTPQFASLLHTSSAVTKTVDSQTSRQPCLSPRGGSFGPSTSRGTSPANDSEPLNKEKRFRKTAEALQKCGLWDIAMKTGNLVKRNLDLQKDIEAFRVEAVGFLRSVMRNPENKQLLDMLSPAYKSTSMNQKHMKTGGDGGESDTTTTTTTSSKFSGNDSTNTSGYSSLFGGGFRQTNPTNAGHRGGFQTSPSHMKHLSG